MRQVENEQKGNSCDLCGNRHGCWVAKKIVALVRTAERTGYLTVHTEPAIMSLLGARCRKHTHPLPEGPIT